MYLTELKVNDPELEKTSVNVTRSQGCHIYTAMKWRNQTHHISDLTDSFTGRGGTSENRNS